MYSYVSLPEGNRCLMHPHSMCSGVSTNSLTKAPAQLVRAILLATAGIGEKRHGEWQQRPFWKDLGVRVCQTWAKTAGTRESRLNAVEISRTKPINRYKECQELQEIFRIANRFSYGAIIHQPLFSPSDRKQIHVLRSSIHHGWDLHNSQSSIS